MHSPTCIPHQAADEALPSVLEALEAASCALRLMSAPNAPPGVVQEEVIESVLELVKHNLQYNVYCFVDGAARQLYRPREEQHMGMYWQTALPICALSSCLCTALLTTQHHLYR